MDMVRRWKERRSAPNLLADGEGAVVGDRLAVEREEHVVAAEVVGGGGDGQHAADEHAAPLVAHVQHFALLAVLQRLPEDAERAEAAALLRVGRLDVGEEVGDRRHRDDVADVLRVLLVLERDANDGAVLVERGPAGVARVDRGVDLDREERDAGVGVPLDLDARDDALRDRDALAALGVPDDAHLVLQARHRAERQGLDALPEARVVDVERREVALVREFLPRRHVLPRVARLAHLDVRRVGDDVRVRQDAHRAVVHDREARARRLLLLADGPRHHRVLAAVHAVHLHHRLRRRRHLKVEVRRRRRLARHAQRPAVHVGVERGGLRRRVAGVERGNDRVVAAQLRRRPAEEEAEAGEGGRCERHSGRSVP